MDKAPFPLNIIRSAFPFLERISPAAAGKLGARLFTMSFHLPFPPKEKAFLSEVEHFELRVGNNTIKVYRKGTGPEVICMHGWLGRGMQFHRVAEALVANGFTFVAFDAQGHGLTGGRQSHLPAFAAGFEAVFQSCHDPVGVIGHSLGVASVAWAARNGATIPRLISLAAPVVAKDILDDFCQRINASPRIQEAIKQRARDDFNIEFEDATLERSFIHLTCPVLAMHGTSDSDVPLAHLAILKGMRPEIETNELEGLSHRSILKADQSIEKMVEWLKREVDLPQEV